MAERVTIKSIARDLGISHMTVSRALSNHPNVHEDTRKAVQDHARAKGYVRNAAAQAMRAGRTRIVGLLLPNITNEFYARFANTLALACEEASYHLIIHLTNDDPKAEQRAIERLHEVQAMAVVMVPAPESDASNIPHLGAMQIIQLIRQRDIPLPHAAILVEDGAALRDAVRHLAREGHRAIAYIGADAKLSSGRARLAAFRAGLSDAGLSEDPDLILTGTPSFDMGRTNAATILQKRRATAIVCGGFEISNGALNAMMDTPRATRANLGFVGYGDPGFYAWIDGGISTIRIPVDQLAHEAVALIGAEKSQSAATSCHPFPAQLILRNTAG